ncbi:MAG: phosphoadenosine phosphosulfate reductase [Novosphingobium lindaniclasticum]|jgi:phosphoadenosine phosphosulfate reductase|uniref:phosphoadenylyl-sulfate reductase n=1 Tax=Novosphingobium lindaniclasticum TaxID=1329895 RepID=UPI00240A0FAC|nr:phosphoadenylyl-sulfate reductase [Novosphingobium lindaniclasticum]MDF2638608.1 phosphoadenosine phosphosulfate reductase [Novosphingobium lindaniclasticum]
MPHTEAARIRDLIDTGPRFDEADAVRLNRLFRGTDTSEMLETVLKEGMAGDIAIVSSFGAESAVLLHLVSRVDPNVPVLFLDTGKHFPETLDYRDLLVKQLGLTNLVNLVPDAEELTKKDENGLRWSYDPDGCCEIRKVKPLEKALLGYDASFSGRKAFQASTRATLPRFEVDTSDAQGRLKVNPLIDWSPERIAAYIAEHDLPAHPLVSQGYPSIGCMPCTSKVAEGEDPRSGRWRGWNKTECGIHVATHSDYTTKNAPEFDPGL